MKSANDIIFEELLPESDGWRSLYTHSDVVKAMKLYAKQAIEEQLKEVALSAEVTVDPTAYYDDVYIIDVDSIMNCTRVELK